ncbi:hypothetical protein AKJ09_08584 [Labilithrix luteola]|uniref:Sulfatase-modifying factor enzyme-like domain-containing protein n=1 Tax=Labilithrix luteola TaxID=1391654 RepID=A0A0K1Q7X9_9BACT|nr:SUMF1/EgtB/PvdO family nonheme iron enzyme [Labilithrix luteola]AKV01921.1 hypothetical protein AKJ09_08584 [Labilithrix luteola]
MSAKHLLALLGVATPATVAGALALACSSFANDAGVRVPAGGVAANSLAAKSSHARDHRSARLGETSKEALVETKSHCPGGMIEIEASGSGTNITRDFCIDRYEASLVEVLPNGDERTFSPFESVEGREVRAVSEPHVFPQGYISAVEAQHACAASGKRLCAVGEWRKACRGPAARTFGYGNRREPGRCNDRGRNPVIALYGRGHWTWRTMNEPQLNQLENTLSRTGDHVECTNGYGVFDMVGNLHEWVADPNGTFYGGYYQDVQSVGHGEGCGYLTTAHEARYHDYSTGFRCCADLTPRGEKALGGEGGASGRRFLR